MPTPPPSLPTRERIKNIRRRIKGIRAKAKQLTTKTVVDKDKQTEKELRKELGLL